MTVTSESWDTRIQRAEELARKSDATREILTFYAKLLQSQKEVDEFLRSRRGWLPSGSLPRIFRWSENVFLSSCGLLRRMGRNHLQSRRELLLHAASATVDEMLLEYWHNPSDTQFFAKAFLQPYARWLAESGGQPLDRAFENNERRCPFCGGMPQVSFLQIQRSDFREWQPGSGLRNMYD